MYTLKWTILTTLLFITTIQSSDLLDEYVKHVEETNKIQSTPKTIQRHKRNTESLSETKNIPVSTIQKAFGSRRKLKKVLHISQNEKNGKRIRRDTKIITANIPSIQKAFGNRQMLKKLLHTSKNEKKIKFNKRNKRQISSESTIYDHRTKRSFPNFENTKYTERKRHVAMMWTHTQILDDRGDIILKWQPRHQEIAFRLEANTRGYVGIGFSPSGGMKGADIVVGWVDDRTGQPFLLVSNFFLIHVQ